MGGAASARRLSLRDFSFTRVERNLMEPSIQGNEAQMDLQESLNDFKFLGISLTVLDTEFSQGGITVDLSIFVEDYHYRVAEAVDRILESFNEGEDAGL
jgi:hypothetical protein